MIDPVSPLSLYHEHPLGYHDRFNPHHLHQNPEVSSITLSPNKRRNTQHHPHLPFLNNSTSFDQEEHVPGRMFEVDASPRLPA